MFWSEEEIKILRSLWIKPEITSKFIKERYLPHRSIYAIPMKANSLGLTKEKIKIDYDKIREIIL